MPSPSRMPFTLILPNGPASKTAGGNHDTGPVTAGYGSGVGLEGAAGSAGGVDSTAAWGTGAGSAAVASKIGFSRSFAAAVASTEVGCPAPLVKGGAAPPRSSALATVTNKMLAIASIAL